MIDFELFLRVCFKVFIVMSIAIEKDSLYLIFNIYLMNIH